MMRRTILLVVLAMLALLAIPVIGIGQPISIHGTPTDVFSAADPANTTVRMHHREMLSTPITLTEESNVIVSFSGEWALGPGVEGLLGLQLVNPVAGRGTDFEWGTHGSRLHTTGAISWTFENVPAGDYTVSVIARVDPVPLGPGGGRTTAVLAERSLIVFVAPTVP